VVLATGGVSYSWTGGATPTTAANSFTEVGTYSVTVTNANGCTATASITITEESIVDLDTDKDGVPDDVEEQEGTDPKDPTNFQDSDGDGVPDYVQDRSIVDYVGQAITVAWGTAESELGLATQVVGVTGRGALINLSVTWDLSGYNPLIAGTNTFYGSAVLPAGIFDTYQLKPAVAITVAMKPAPLDVTLSSNSFVAIPDQYFQLIGTFTVLDPSDAIHALSLPQGVQDNQYFEVMDGILFWSSSAQVPGSTAFTILVRVTDRAGNVLEKNFQITRNRTPLDQLEVLNTFTPNNDRVNDSWGVPALRYYEGVKIEVFEVGSGKRVFYTEDPDVSWDGRVDGKDPVVTAYLWVISVGETGEVRRGMLNVLTQ
jgi:gliding motility-associated-like protein